MKCFKILKVEIIYIDFDKNEISHYSENILVGKNKSERSNTFSLLPKENKLPQL